MLIAELPDMSVEPPPALPTDDADLLQRYFQAGDRDAMAVLFERHAGAAFRTALAYLRHPADAEEAVQISFLHILTNGARLWKSENANVRGWIMSIVVNTCLMKLRENFRRRARHEDLAANQPQSFQPDHEAAELAARALQTAQSLPLLYRVPVLLRYVEGFSIKDVAHALALPEKTVHSQISRGIDQIRESLGDAGFSASMIAIPNLLSSATPPAAPIALTASFKTLIANAASTAATGGAGGAVTASGAKIAGAGALAKIAISLVCALAAACAVAWAIKPAPVETKGDAPPATPPAPAQKLSPAMAEILDRKVDVDFDRHFPWEVLYRLQSETGLASSFPRPLREATLFTLRQKQVSVREILTKLAADSGMILDFGDDIAVFWQKADDALIARLESTLKTGSVQARCEAVYDLAQLSDKRIYPLLSAAILDEHPEVAAEAVEKFNPDLCRWADAHLDVERLLALYSNDRFSGLHIPLARLLVATRDPRAVDAVLELIGPVDSLRRMEGINLLAQMDNVVAAQTLARLVAENSFATMAVRSFCQAPYPQAAETIASIWKTSSDEFKVDIENALCRVRTPRGVDGLIALSKIADPTLQSVTLKALCASGYPRAVNFVKAAAAGQDHALRQSAEEALRASDAAFDHMIALLNGTDQQQRVNAAFILRASTHPRAEEKLIELLTDSNVDVARCAMLDMSDFGRMRSPQYHAAMAALLNSPDQAIRDAVIGPLVRQGNREAVAKLQAHVNDPVGRHRPIVMSALYGLRDSSAIDLIITLTRDPDALLRAPAVSLLAARSGPLVMERLLELAGDPDPQVRAAAASSFWMHRDPRGTAAALAACRDKDKTVRSLALTCLARMSDPHSRIDLFNVMKADPVPAAASLSFLSATGAIPQTDPRFEGAVSEIRKAADAERVTHPEPAEAAQPPATRPPRQPAPAGDF